MCFSLASGFFSAKFPDLQIDPQSSSMEAVDRAPSMMELPPPKPPIVLPAEPAVNGGNQNVNPPYAIYQVSSPSASADCLRPSHLVADS